MTRRGSGYEESDPEDLPGRDPWLDDLDPEDFAAALDAEVGGAAPTTPYPLVEEDERFARLLSSPRPSSAGSDLRRELRGQTTFSGTAEDLLQRLNTLDYLEGLVGERPVGEIPERLGDLRIRGLLGRGGMGAVYDAFQETLEREVAVKVLSPALTADPKMRERFRNEARANASLHHQHIVPVFGFGEAAGLLYFSMEKVPGVSLDKHLALRRGELLRSPDALRSWAGRFAGVADALSHAHRRGVLHRDVKPGNVLVHPDSTLALADFGLSKIMTEASVGLSGAGGFFGTLHYASPEQATGRSVGPASDLYSLGVTMFEVFTGELPLPGDTPEALLQSILNTPARRIRQIDSKAPKDLDAVLARLLEKEPADRYQDGEELARDLLRVSDREPVRFRRRLLTVRLARWINRHRTVSFSIALAVVLAVVSVLFFREVRHTRYDDSLQAFLKDVGREPGPASGTPRALELLTGVEPSGSARTGPSDPVRHLRWASKLAAPGDLRHELYEKAYRRADDQIVLSLMAEGRPVAAKRMVEDRLERLASTGTPVIEPESWLRLYRLRLLRALLCLTSQVADVQAARDELLRASTTRVGAFFPQLLRGIVEPLADGRSESLPAAIEPLLASGPAGCREIAAALIGSFAGVRRSPNSWAMRFDDLPMRERVRLGRVAAGWLPSYATVDFVPAAFGCPMEREIRALLEPPFEDSSLEKVGRMLEGVSADSELQRWSVVVAMLGGEDSPMPRRGDGRALSEVMIARGFIELLRLRSKQDVLADLRALGPYVEPLVRSSSLVPEVRHTLSSAWTIHQALTGVGRSSDARRAADEFARACADSPGAYVARFRAQLLDRFGIDQASCDLARALQISRTPYCVFEDIELFLRRRAVPAGLLPSDEVERWIELAESFVRQNL